MPLAAGNRLGPYEIVVQLGAGGMGEVYRARDTRLGRAVAVKVLPPHRSDPAARERFEREARAIAALNHPNICQLYDVGTQDGVDFLVLEYLEGETLADRLAKGALPPAALLRCALDIIEALDAAHRRGIVHRDFKPANVFLTADGVCKVLDFGLAKLVREAELPAAETVAAALTSAGTAVGTVAYMSPEQARGDPLDERTDIFSFGALLYEMATGQGAFSGKTSAVIFKAILDDPAPAPSARNPILPARLDDIVGKALEKDRTLRYQTAADMRADLQRLKRDSESGRSAAPILAQRASPRRRAAVVAGSILALAAVAAAVFYALQRRPPVRQGAWEQLTFFTDSAVYPALSPDGRMLAFIRGGDPFMTTGDIYVKLLPSGDAVQLTHDASIKLAPAFSPDGSRIAYGTGPPFDTWVVPVLGGQPSLLFKNASSLSWIDNGRRLLFSEIREGLHMVVVTTNPGRGENREVYAPPGDRSMVHHSYLSADRRWVLLVVMDERGALMPCEVVRFDGSGGMRPVGPPHARCTAGAWSPDGKWVYVTAGQGGQSHIWRQRFPDGPLQQVTSGTTEEAGLAMSADGASLLTSVGVHDDTVWLHDERGDRQLSSEGSALGSTLSADRSRIYFLLQTGNSGFDLWTKSLVSGTAERVASASSIQAGASIRGYSVAPDGKQVAITIPDDNGVPHVWLAPVDRRSPPRQLTSSSSQDSPSFLPNGDLVLRASEAGQNFVYRTRPDGTDRRRVVPTPILDLVAVSPDGRWVVAAVKNSGDESPAAAVAYPLEGGLPVRLCTFDCRLGWDVTGQFFHVTSSTPGDTNTYLLPVNPARGLPDLPGSGIGSGSDLKQITGAVVVPEEIDSVVGSTYYSYTKESTRRNIYRIPLND